MVGQVSCISFHAYIQQLFDRQVFGKQAQADNDDVDNDSLDEDDGGLVARCRAQLRNERLALAAPNPVSENPVSENSGSESTGTLGSSSVPAEASTSQLLLIF